MKTCSKCKLAKELSEYAKDKSRDCGLHARCRVCDGEYARKKYKENPESMKRASRKWQVKHRFKLSIQSSIAAAKKTWAFAL